MAVGYALFRDRKKSSASYTLQGCGLNYAGVISGGDIMSDKVCCSHYK